MAKIGKFDLNAVTVPTFTVKLLNGKILRVRSIIMKEYRNLLLAKDGSTNSIDHVDAVEQVVKNCVVNEDFDIKNLTAYDFEIIFVKAFQFGTGDSKIPVKFQCTNVVPRLNADTNEMESKTCGSVMKSQIILNDIKPSVEITDIEMQEENKSFEIQENIHLTLRRPLFKDTPVISGKSAEAIIKTILNNLVYVTVNDTMTYVEDITNEDLDQLFDRISQFHIKEMYDYVAKIPRISYDINLKCPTCKKKYLHSLLGIEDFFM